jgi:opacity protein-like surface antigen
MKRIGFAALVAAAVSLALAGAAHPASAQGSSYASRTELSILGGAQSLNQNDTAMPDGFVNFPVAGALAYRLTDKLALEGEFSWIISAEQSVEVGPGVSQDSKSPDILAYQANVRAGWPVAAWTPYVTAGLGAVTFLSNTGPNAMPALTESQTMFGVNFGAGALYPLRSGWGLRADFRELAAFPASDTPGLSSAGQADAVWMERFTVGVTYKF